jgi:hypothetical protein
MKKMMKKMRRKKNKLVRCIIKKELKKKGIIE